MVRWYTVVMLFCVHAIRPTAVVCGSYVLCCCCVRSALMGGSIIGMWACDPAAPCSRCELFSNFAAVGATSRVDGVSE